MSSRFVYAVVAAAMVVLFINCNKNSSAPPAGPTAPARNVIFTEGFENIPYDLDDTLHPNPYYSKVTSMPGWTADTISTDAAHSGTHSLTSDSNLSGIKRPLDPAIADSIAGLEFYLMAKKAEHTNIYAALATSGSSYNGLWVIMGIGIDKSDSLMFIYNKSPSDPLNEQINFAPLDSNKWYKCDIEYNFTDSTLTYSVDGTVVHAMNVPQPPSLPRFVVLRDSAGAQGPADYYLDDVTVYKR
jgi:hypothetical protein